MLLPLLIYVLLFSGTCFLSAMSDACLHLMRITFIVFFLGLPSVHIRSIPCCNNGTLIDEVSE
jgi:hypothetical protein